MKKWLLLIFTTLSLLTLIIYCIYSENNKIFSNNIIDSNKVNDITNKKELYLNNVELYYNDNIIPYSNKSETEEGFYLLSQINIEEYKGFISNKDGFNIKIIKPSKSKKEIISSNDNLFILLYNDKFYKIVNLKMTNLPVMSLTFKEDMEGRNSLGEIFFYEPNGDKRENILAIKNYNVRYHVRGASSRLSPKKSYKINILDKKGNKKKVSMLGLREDNDWILNSIQINDFSYMREKIDYDIWNQLSSSAKHNMEYVEFILNNEYMGIYYLQEPADMKTFKGNDNDLLISIKKWRSRGRALYKDYEINWGDLDSVDEMYFEDGLNNNDELKVKILRTFVPMHEKKGYDYKSDLKLSYDLDNSANYELFLNLIMATDNDYKNEKILFREIKEKEYIIERTPWDLDWSLNNENVEKRFEINELIRDEILDPDIEQSKEFKNIMKEKYWEIRNTIYNEKSLNELLYSYKLQLQSNGAVKRDIKKWQPYEKNKLDFEKSCENIEQFFKERIKFLDWYYGD